MKMLSSYFQTLIVSFEVSRDIKINILKNTLEKQEERITANEKKLKEIEEK